MAGSKIIYTHSWHWLSEGPGEKGSCSILIKELQSDPTFFPVGQLENGQNGQQGKSNEIDFREKIIK